MTVFATRAVLKAVITSFLRNLDLYLPDPEQISRITRLPTTDKARPRGSLTAAEVAAGGGDVEQGAAAQHRQHLGRVEQVAEGAVPLLVGQQVGDGGRLVPARLPLQTQSLQQTTGVRQRPGGVSPGQRRAKVSRVRDRTEARRGQRRAEVRRGQRQNRGQAGSETGEGQPGSETEQRPGGVRDGADARRGQGLNRS